MYMYETNNIRQIRLDYIAVINIDYYKTDIFNFHNTLIFI